MLTNDSNVYVVMSGNFTPAQRHIVKSQCMIYVSDLKEVYEWLRENNPNLPISRNLMIVQVLFWWKMKIH
jgi:hypothetical protein